MDHLRSVNKDKPGQHGETLSLLKIQKFMVVGACNPSYSGGRVRQENCLNPGGGGCSDQRLCHCTPAWEMEKDSVSNSNNNNNALYF